MDTTFTPPWTPPKKVEELYEKVLANNRFAAINRPTAGKRNEKELPVGAYTQEMIDNQIKFNKRDLQVWDKIMELNGKIENII